MKEHVDLAKLEYLHNIPEGEITTSEFTIVISRYNIKDADYPVVQVTINEHEEREHSAGWQPESYFIGKNGVGGLAQTWPYRICLPYSQNLWKYDYISPEQRAMLKLKDAVTIAEFIERNAKIA